MNDGTEDDVCDGYPEHRRVEVTYQGSDGTAWICRACDAEGWEDAVTSDGTEDEVDQGCCADRCDGSCGGYGFAFELAARNVRDGIEGARPVGTWIDEVALSEEAERGYDVDKLVPRRVAFIGQPGSGKTSLAGASGERDCDGTEPVFEGEIPATASCCGTTICGSGIVGMFSLGGDLSRRAKDISRGRDEFTPFGRDEALRRITEEDADLLRRLERNDGPICKCPVEACVCRTSL